MTPGEPLRKRLRCRLAFEHFRELSDVRRCQCRQDIVGCQRGVDMMLTCVDVEWQSSCGTLWNSR